MILGVDPGFHGALAFLENGEVVDVFDVPLFQVKVNKSLKNEVDIPALRRILLAMRGQVTHAMIERVQPMPATRQDEEGNRATMGATSAFNFGRTFASLYTAVAMAGIPYTLVMPAVWKRALAVPKDKDGARHRASQLMPSSSHHWPLKKHDGRAEAALIALYGSRQSGWL